MAEALRELFGKLILDVDCVRTAQIHIQNDYLCFGDGFDDLHRDWQKAQCCRSGSLAIIYTQALTFHLVSTASPRPRAWVPSCLVF